VVASDAYREAPLHVVFLHMVPGGKSSWHGEQEIRRLFVPILNEAEVDVMLCGHYHRYGWIDDGSRGTNFPILINSNRDRSGCPCNGVLRFRKLLRNRLRRTVPLRREARMERFSWRSGV